MKALLALSRGIDWLTHKMGWIAAVAVIASCFISAGNAIIRFIFSNSSNAWLEIQWYLFATCVMLGAAHVLKVNEHVRVDVFYGRFSGRGNVLIDLFGLVFFLMPVMGAMLYLSWPYFHSMWVSGEVSGNAGGLIRWPAVLTLPVGFALVLLQGLSEIIKRVAWLMNLYDMDIHYERPLQ
jgi:TRAP-type mannitol/chloroaromatic compound transport system permease small subunit